MDADPAGNSILFNLLLLLFFTLLNAFFAGAEMAVVSVNKNRIRSMADEGNKKAKVIEGLFEDSTKFLSTIQVAITFAGFYSSASAASGISPVLAQSLEAAGVPYSSQIAYNGVTLVLMFFNLVFGELVPKRIALQKAEAFCMFTVMPVHYISIILSPFIKLLSMSTKFVLKLLGMKTEDEEEAVTEEEVKALLKMGNESGTFDDDEKEMIDSVFKFDRRTAREIMVPRREVIAFDIDDPFEEMIDEILETRHNRIPVYEENIDNIIGVLHVKDMMIEMRKHPLKKGDVRQMLRQPFFIPETKCISKIRNIRINTCSVYDDTSHTALRTPEPVSFHFLIHSTILTFISQRHRSHKSSVFHFHSRNLKRGKHCSHTLYPPIFLQCSCRFKSFRDRIQSTSCGFCVSDHAARNLPFFTFFHK